MQETFPMLFGNADAKARLALDIRNGTLSHAIMIAGPAGSGRKTMLKSIVMALNCENKSKPSNDFPCGKCSCCRRIAEENFTDFKILKLQPGKASIGADELRSFKSDMYLSPSESSFKVYAIDRAEAMTAAAQNALLKALEEPPNNVHIILITTEAAAMLSTIRSRVQLVQTELFRHEDMKEHLLSISSVARRLHERSASRLDAIIVCAAGVIGKAISMLDEKSIADTDAARTSVAAVISALPKRTQFAKLYSAISALPTKREELTYILRMLLGALRDMVVVQTSEQANMLFYLSRSEAAEAMGNMSLSRLISVQNIIVSALRDIDRNVVIPSLLTDVAVAIKESN